jgi:heme/copper-type cytochrome/quinol oxidase subunit 2
VLVMVSALVVVLVVVVVLVLGLCLWQQRRQANCHQQQPLSAEMLLPMKKLLLRVNVFSQTGL